MSELEKRMQETQEFIENAQDVIKKVNDMMWALNTMVNKQKIENDRSSMASAASHTVFDQELQALVQRYLNPASQNSPAPIAENSTSASGKLNKPRPGKYRQLV